MAVAASFESVERPRQNFSRKRALSSTLTPLLPTKRLNKALRIMPETSSKSCHKKRARKRKTRRDEEKNRKFLTKMFRAEDSPASYPKVTTIIKIDGKDDHSQVNCNVSNTSDVGRISNDGYMFNQNYSVQSGNHNMHHKIGSNDLGMAGDTRVLSLTYYGIKPYDEQTNGVNHHHCNHLNETKPLHDRHGEDLLVLLEKENGTTYAVCNSDDRVLGRGGFGIVYKGFKLEGATKYPVAIKAVEKTSIDCFVEDDELGLVPEEVAMLNKIKGHPNAIQLIDYIQLNDAVVVIMERPENCKDLFEILAQQTSAMPEIHARKMIKQLSGVLLAMEKKGIVHRDIKCENVLVDLDNEQVKLIDFGLATTYTPGKTMKKFCGTRKHAPPEYILNGEYEGPQETVWTSGLLLYYLVCGDEPFSDFIETTRKPFRVPSFLSSELKDLLVGMLRKNPNRRLTLEQVYHHPWMTTQTNSLCMPFGYRRSFKQKI